MKYPIHNAFFQTIFSIPQHAAGLLRHLLAKWFADLIDWDAVQRESSQWSNGLLEERRGDLMVSAPFLDGSTRAFFPLEHQSTADPIMSLRDAEYLVWALRYYLLANPGSTSLPVMVAAIVSHVGDGRSWARSLEKLLCIKEDMLPALLDAVGKHLLRFEPLVLDLNECSDAQLMAMEGPPMTRFALVCLKHGRDPQHIIDSLDAWTNDLKKIARSPFAAFSFQATVCYLRRVLGGAPTKTIWNHFEKVIGMEAVEDTSMMLDLDPDGDIGAQFIALGRQLWIEDMRLECIQDTKRATVERQLGRRFGPLPDWAIDKLGAGSSSQLDVWADRLLDAGSLENVFADA